jgi:hypothetical protein
MESPFLGMGFFMPGSSISWDRLLAFARAAILNIEQGILNPEVLNPAIFAKRRPQFNIQNSLFSVQYSIILRAKIYSKTIKIPYLR